MSGYSSLPALLAPRAAAGTLAHAYILAGPEEGRTKAALAVARAMVCTGETPPCGSCRGCQKAAKGIHPDIITVSPEGGKELTVGQIRELRADAYVLPNEAPRKVYLVQNAQRMNLSAQNAFLKVLEEGPAYAAFLLLTENPSALLPTIRSRCETVRIAGGAASGEDVARKGGELAGLLLGGDPWALISWCVPYEKAKREDVLPILEEARASLLTYRTAKTTKRAVTIAQGLGEAIAAGGRNLGIGALWGWVWALSAPDIPEGTRR